MKLICLEKGRLSVPYPELLIGINANRTGRHLLTKCDGQSFTLIVNILILQTPNTSDTVVNDLGPFKVKSHTRALVSKDIVLETYLAAVENKLFDADRASHSPRVTFRKLKIRLHVNCVSPRILWLGCRIRAPDLLF